MKTFLIFVTLFLSGAWAYSSWYWYSCEIREVCTSSKKTEQKESILASQNTSNPKDIGEDLQIISTEKEVIIEVDGNEKLEEENTEEILSEVPSLSVDDVTAPSPVNPQAQTEIKEEKREDETSRKEDDKNNDERNINKEEKTEIIYDIQDICINPIVGPISIGAKNNPDDVAKLESFLLKRGDIVKADGIYGQDDFAAIEKFQETYRSEILTPWGINNPTGYVGRTTIQKIQALACN